MRGRDILMLIVGLVLGIYVVPRVAPGLAV